MHSSKPSLKKITQGIAVTLLPFLLLACGSKEAPETQETITDVDVTRVERQSLPQIFEASGSIHAGTSAVLASKVVGNVTRILVADGDRVHVGQLLVEIDDRDAAAQLRSARAAGEEVEGSIRAARAGRDAAEAANRLAASTLARYEALRERNSVSPQEMDEVTARARGAAAELTRAEETLAAVESRRIQARSGVESASAASSWTRITSPVDGFVASLPAEVGMQAMPGIPLITIDDDRQYRLETRVEASIAGTIHTGDEATVTVDTINTPFAGRVVEVGGSIDPATRTRLVKVLIKRPDNAHAVRSGMFGRAAFKSGKRDTITVPPSALMKRGQIDSVWTVDEEGRAALRIVTIGNSQDNAVEILSGLDDGERIVTSGLERVHDGATIETKTGSTP